ncbi:MAG: 2,3-bisphosphoglycerate-independent phosphoglycerate mutase [Anaerolineae bacterium]|nr:2,3-bisphosphoglycerate-independent phosphoglycerate mutase [Anaerolineae bacterium]
MAYKPVMLIILDGWGIREMEEGNAPYLANIPNYRNWERNNERAVVDASEEWVGLVPGQMGNSEVGHLNLGAGRIVYQDITRINIAIREGSLAKNDDLLECINYVKDNGKKLHLIGLLSDGGVHSHEDHLYALLDIVKNNGVNPVLHLITDGRDTPTESGIGFVKKLEAFLEEDGNGRISTISGRYYAMDRDKRWERTQKAYDAMVYRTADHHAETASEALKVSYADGVTDEFVIPSVVGDDDNLTIDPGDGIICYNFRADRMRQLVQTLAFNEVEDFEGKPVEDLHIVTFTSYMPDLPVTVLFHKQILDNVLAQVISNAGKQQYHSAETEKYPHVTFFFNGRKEDPFPGEDRKIVPSPKVATYDLQPEMSAYELTEATLERLKTHNDDFLLINFANPDMVGHTGSLEAAIKAVETVDECANKLVEAVQAKGGVAIVTADHGNCERMIELATGEAHTYHTTNPVGLFVLGPGYFRLRPRGKLADVAPTILDLMGLEKPKEMTGESLVDVHVD